MKIDKYFRIARIYPAIIILIPFLIFSIYCSLNNLKDIFDNVLRVKIIGTLTTSVVLFYLLIQINRFLGKFLFERYIFQNELEIPTTLFLLFSDGEFSNEYKIHIRNRIHSDFQINMPNEQDEAENIENTKKRIVEAVGLIRQKVKNGRLLLQHNIEYGFARNLIGGSIVGTLMSIFDMYYFFRTNNNLIAWVSFGLLFFFLCLLLLHRVIIVHLGNQYARRLFQEYLQQ